MKNKLLKINQVNKGLAEEYRQLISLSVLSELEGERIAQILEIANHDEDLNYLIDKIETANYLESKLNWDKGLQYLLELVSIDEPLS